MIDFAAARRMMVDGQVRTSDVTDPRIIAAMLELPRERFVSGANAALAYLDLDVPVRQASGREEVRRLIKPMVLAKMVQAAAVKETDHVLDVGCATGYSSAVLGKLAASVVALEEDAALAGRAADALAASGAGNVTLASGPLFAGWKHDAPYDVIMLQGACEVVPDSLLGQLKEGGRLPAVVGGGPMGKATIYRMTGKHATAQPLFDAAALLLPGFAKPAAFVF